jgi:hypothetical protein
MIYHKSSENFDIRSPVEFRPEIAHYRAEMALQSAKPMNEFQELVRDRIRARVDNASTLARFLKEHPSTITKRLQRGGPALCLDFLDRLREFFGGWTPAEMCAEPGAAITSVTAIESSLLAHFRQMTELERRSLLTILERPIYTQSPHAKKSRLGRAMLTVKEQELVDLFARVKRDGVREGVLKTLRGAAQADDVPLQGKPRTTG